MLAAFDEERDPRALCLAETAAIAHAHARGVSGIHQQIGRRTDATSEVDALVEEPAKHQWAAALRHRVQVEQEIGSVDEASQLARAAQLH
jgi:hypothetical protein